MAHRKRQVIKLFWYRDFRILDNSSRIIGEATTTWFIIDLITRRPQRTDSYVLPDVSEGVESVFPDKLNKLAPVEETEYTKLVQVAYGDLDIHEHVNNVRYTDWIVNSLTFDFLKTHKLKEIEINYLSETSYNDEISVTYAKTEKSEFLHSLRRRKDDAELCRARTVWERDQQNG